MRTRVVYSNGYDINPFGLAKYFQSLHPFDLTKYSKVWQYLQTSFPEFIHKHSLSPPRPVDNHELELVHSREYLTKLTQDSQSASYIAQILEIPALANVPNFILNNMILKPMKLAVMGTYMAAGEALQQQIAINLSGGYHHTNCEAGEGFCIYSDIGYAIYKLRAEGRLQSPDPILIIDLDAHQGNGLERIFMEDRSVHFFDVYNQDIYPQDTVAAQKLEHSGNLAIKLRSQCSDDLYLSTLHTQFDNFIDAFIDDFGKPKLVFYNAGTDIYAQDPIGRLNVSQDGIFKRDLYIFKKLMHYQLPFVMVPSGGYTKASHRMISKSVSWLLELESD